MPQHTSRTRGTRGTRREVYRPTEAQVKQVAKGLCAKLAPRAQYAPSEAGTRKLIYNVARAFMYKAAHPLTKNDLGGLEEEVRNELWRQQVDPGADQSQQASNAPSPFYHLGADKAGFGSSRGIGASARSQRGQRSQRSQRSSGGMSASKSLPSLRGPATGRSSARSGSNRSAVASARSTTSTQVAQKTVHDEPVLALQTFYRILKKDKVKAAKEKALKEHEELVKVLDWQIKEQRKREKEIAEHEDKLFQAELQRAADMEARVKADDAKRKQARIAEFKEREVERRRVMREKERELQRQRAEERREALAAAEDARRLEELKNQRQQQVRKELKKTFEIERARQAEIRRKYKDEADMVIDPKVIEAEAKKIADRVEAIEQMKKEYIKRNIEKQEKAANATLKFRAPLEAEQRRMSRTEDRWMREQVAGWQEDLKQRELRKKRLEEERLAALRVQMAEQERRRQAEAKEAEEYAKYVNDGAAMEKLKQEEAKRKKLERKLEAKKFFARQLLDAKRADPKRLSQYDRLDDLSREEIDAILADPVMAKRVKAEMDKASRSVNGNLLPASN